MRFLTIKTPLSRQRALSNLCIALIAGSFLVVPASAPEAFAQPSQNSGDTTPSFVIEVIIKPHTSSGEGSFFYNLPGRFCAIGVTMKTLIEQAYDLNEYQIVGGPSWVNSDRYDIDVQEAAAKSEGDRRLSVNDVRLMLRSVLANRFNLKLSRQTNEGVVYTLVVANNGPKFKTAPVSSPLPQGIRIGTTEINVTGLPMSVMANELSKRLGRPVIDGTGLKGNYALKVNWSPDSREISIPVALQEQLGLKLEPRTGTVETLALEGAERPVAN